MAVGRVVYGRVPHYFLDGKPVSKAEYDRAFPSKIKEVLESGQVADGHRPGCWPMVSDALAVHPTQIGEAHDRARRAGVPTEFTGQGQPIFTSQVHRRDYARKVEGRVVDRNACYGDPC